MDFETKYWHLAQFQLAKRLSRDEMKYMCTTMVMKHYKKGVEIDLGRKKMSKDVYFLKMGTVKIVNYTSDGEEVIKYIIRTGDIFGIMGLMGLENEDDYAVALEDAVVCILDAKYFKELMQENQKLNNHIFKLTGIRIKKLERNLASLLYKDAETRIEDFIIDYTKGTGKEEDGFFVAKNLLTNGEIAKLTSTSRQTVNKTLNSLRHRKVIDFDKKVIKVNKDVVQKNV